MPIPSQRLALLALAAACAEAAAQDAGPAPLPAQAVTVTATRTEAAAFDVPASIDRVALAPDTDARPGINLSETLGGVPGLLARDRQNYAQDVQLSVRGFGARSTFGIRGVRLYVDGIPATMPDGQGQITNVDLGSAASVEVLRGPFSALYGNSSGGVLQVFTEDGAGRPRLQVGVGAGSDGQRRVESKLTGAEGSLSYVLSGSHFQTDGYRDHSAARRDIENFKLGWQLDDASRLTLVGNGVQVPEAQDPMGLSRAELQADPRGVDPSALQFNTRKSLSQSQAGLVYDRRVDAGNALRVLVYGGHRETTQYQSIPVASQANPLNPGGVIELVRDYDGADLRWTTGDASGARAWSVVGGLALDALREHRQGYQNFAGTGAGQQLGVEGALRRDEINRVTDVDPYVQADWHPARDLTLDVGVRRSSVRFSSHDRYVVGPNPDDSGDARYAATLPVAGVLWAVRPDVHLYATDGRGFETPTLNELAYRPSGLTGLNFDLRPARSTSVETGVKLRSDALGDFTAAVFSTRTTDEIVTLSNVGGRSTYQNVAATRRRGLELRWNRELPHDFALQLAYTLLDARYAGAFESCTTTPCTTPSTAIAAGNRIPGIARNAAFASLAWAPPQGWHAAMEARALSRSWVNDTNSDAASGFVVASLSGGYVRTVGAWQWNGFARVDNVANRRYVGSVIVNEGNGRYFEPSPGRTLFAGASGSIRF